VPATFDRPKHTAPSRSRRKLLLLLIVSAVVLFGGWTTVSYWVDLLWFRSLGYGDVFLRTLSLQFGIFALFAAATFLILYGTFLALRRTHQADLPRGREIVIAGQPINLSVEPALRVVAFCVSLAIACVTGAAMMEEWLRWRCSGTRRAP
jgi:uncharacterized protein